MFETSKLESNEHLDELVRCTREKMKQQIVEVKYPNVLRQKIGREIWDTVYQDIDKLNEKLLKCVDGRGGVYSIFTAKPEKEWELKYIGQVKSNGARQRVRSHLIWRNKKTVSGKSTGSKFDEIMSEVTKGREIAFSFVEIEPESLRHYVEEVLINKCQPLWNYNGTTLNGQKSKGHRSCL